VWGIRRQVSLLKAHGHSEPHRYPVGMVWDESNLVVEHLNRAEATRAVLLQMAVSSVLSEEAGKEFKKIVERLTKE
jgi:hypothetical protein